MRHVWIDLMNAKSKFYINILTNYIDKKDVHRLQIKSSGMHVGSPTRLTNITESKEDDSALQKKFLPQARRF